MRRHVAFSAAKHACAEWIQQYSARSISAEAVAVCYPADQYARMYARHQSTDAKTSLLNANPKSLAADRVIAVPQPGVEKNWFTRTLLKIGGFYSKESTQMRASKAWHDCITEQAENKKLFEVFGLEQAFATKYALLSIHMWLCLVRLRSEGKDGKELAQRTYENFTEDIEKRVRAAGVKVRIGKHLAELEQMFYGGSLAYDEALAGKEDLSSALLRNVYANDPAKRKHAELLARYIKRELACLSMTHSDAVMNGRVNFSSEFLGT